MRTAVFARALLGVTLVVSCGGGSGQTGAGGSGGGGRGGSGAAGGGAQTGGAGGASCDVVSACGGDIVGTWAVTASCLTASKDLSSICAGASATVAYTFTGTVTYGADQSFTPALTLTATAHEYYPSGCAPFGMTCAELGQAGADAASVVSQSCSLDATGACNCDSVQDATTSNIPGTYSVSGDVLTTMQGSATATAVQYCVQGGVLHQIVPPGDGGLQAAGDIVFAKQ